jgi:hypothetical protein
MPAIGSFIAGVLIALCTTFCSALGLVFQKLAHNKSKGKPKKNFDLRFITGISLMALSAVVSLAVFALCGQAVASSFATITIIWSLLLSAIILKEPILIIDIIVCSTLILGAVVAVIFGSRVPRKESSGPTTIAANFSSFRFILTISCLAGLCIVSMCFTTYLTRQKKHLSIFGQRLACFSSIFVACIFCGFTGTFSTGFVGLIAFAFTTSANDVFTYIPTYFIFLSLTASVILQITYLNKALKLRPNNEVVPLYQSGVCTIGVALGLLIFGEGTAIVSDLVFFSCGIVLCIIGLLLLGFKRTSSSPLSELIEQLLIEHETIITRHRRTQSCPACRKKDVKIVQLRMQVEERNVQTERAPSHRSRATLAAVGLAGIIEESEEEQKQFLLPSPILRRLSLSPRLLQSALRAKIFQKENRPLTRMEKVSLALNKPALVIASSYSINQCLPPLAICQSVPIVDISSTPSV